MECVTSRFLVSQPRQLHRPVVKALRRETTEGRQRPESKSDPAQAGGGGKAGLRGRSL